MLYIIQVAVANITVTVGECLPGQTLRKADSDSKGLTCECDFKRSSGLILSCGENDMIILKVYIII